MNDGRGRFPRGLLSNAPPPRSREEVRGQYRRRDFLGTNPDVYLPPDEEVVALVAVVGEEAVEKYHRPRAEDWAQVRAVRECDGNVSRWRWYRDPLVIGAALGLAVVVWLFWMVMP